MLRLLWWLLGLAIVTSTVFASAASLEVDGGVIQVFEYTAVVPTLTPTATTTTTVTPGFTTTKVVLQPSQLKLPALPGEIATARVWLPAGTSAEQVDQGSLRMCVGAGPCGAASVSPGRVEVIHSGEQSPPDFGGFDVLELAFDRVAVFGLIPDPRPGKVWFAVSGRLLVDAAPGGARRSLQAEPRYVALGGCVEVELVLAATGTPTTTPTATRTPAPSVTTTPAASTTTATTTSSPLVPTPGATLAAPSATRAA